MPRRPDSPARPRPGKPREASPTTPPGAKRRLSPRASPCTSASSPRSGARGWAAPRRKRPPTDGPPRPPTRRSAPPPRCSRATRTCARASRRASTRSSRKWWVRSRARRSRGRRRRSPREDSRAYASLDARALEAASIAPDDDFEAMSLARCVRETHRRLLVASFDAPLALADDMRETASREEARRARAVARAREGGAEAAVTAAEAAARRFVEDVARAKAQAPDKGEARGARRVFADGGGETSRARRGARVCARRAPPRRARLRRRARRRGARRPRQARALRAAAGGNQAAPDADPGLSLPLPLVVADTPGRDAALACGDDRVHLIRELAPARAG